MFAELPLVEIASNTSPGWPRARMIWIWLNCSPAKSGLSVPEKKLEAPKDAVVDMGASFAKN